MKKIVFILLILLCGCGKEEVLFNYNSDYYKTAPYKKGVANYSIDIYDKLEVEKMLMNLSTNYFKINNSLYQEGQYLQNDEIKKIIEEYNSEINQNFIISIYEQNYLTVSNELKGISLAIVVKCQDLSGQYLEQAKHAASKVVKYVYDKVKTRIVVGIYLDNDGILKGGFKYIGENNKDEIDLKNINYNYQYLDSNYIMNNDISTYDAIYTIKNSLNDYSNLYSSFIGLYQDNNLISVTVNLTKSNFNRSEILSIADIITNYFNLFNSKVEIGIYFKSNNNLKAYLVKKRNNNDIEIYLMEE